MHTDTADYDPNQHRPYRTVILFLHAVRALHPDYEIWRDFHYEYARDRLAVDLIDSSDRLRLWVDEQGDAEAFDAAIGPEEEAFLSARAEYLRY